MLVKAVFAIIMGVALSTYALAEDGIVGTFPDVLKCTGTNDSNERIYRVNSKLSPSGEVFYRHVDVLYSFNSDGTFSSSVNSPLSDCDNQSVTALVSADKAFFLRNQPVQTGAAGQMSYFNLAACPSGWTQQIQLDRTINPDSPMVLCRKD